MPHLFLVLLQELVDLHLLCPVGRIGGVQEAGEAGSGILHGAALGDQNDFAGSGGNTLSIDQNVGGMASHLRQLRSKEKYWGMKRTYRKLVLKLPGGRHIYRITHNIKDRVRRMLVPTTIFESMGFTYLGPVDGHDTEQLITLLRIAKDMNCPVLIHAMTRKGKGYVHSEEHPKLFHGIGKFDPETGEPLKKAVPTFSDAFGKTMVSLAAEDPKICAITAAMSDGTGLEVWRNTYPDRFFDVGIAEQHAVTFAAGLAKSGLKPVVAIYSSFMQRAYDQLIHDAALQKQKMIIAVDRAGFVGEDGETHQGIFDVAFMNTISNFTIYAPSTYDEMRKDMFKAVYKDSNVIAIRYPRGSECELPDDFVPTYDVFDIYGDADSQISLVTYGRLFGNACKAYKKLKEQGKSIRVIKLNKIKPLDPSIVEVLKDSRSIYFFEEGIQNGGVGEKLALRLLESGYRGEYKLTAVDYCFVEQGSVQSTIEKNNLDTESMIKIVGGAFGE